MIYSASRRTDLAAFHPDFLAGRLARSRKLDAVVYWTKNPRNLADHPTLAAWSRRWPAVVQLTVTGLAGTKWEPAVEPLSAWRDALRAVAADRPAGAVRWRFDPVIPLRSGPEGFAELTDRLARTRDDLAAALGHDLDEVTISFPTPYRKAVRRVEGAGLAWPTVEVARQRDWVRSWGERLGLRFRACCQPALEGLEGVAPAACIDAGLFDKLYGTALSATPPDGGQRPGCGCARSTDIGAYDRACRHGCLYCYAAGDGLEE